VSDRWDRHFLQLCLDHARMSKDPSTRVGAIIVGPDKEVISAGFNGFPKGVVDSQERLNDRESKLELIVHAEMNAVLAAARIGAPLRGCTMYISATNNNGLIWGGPPCVRCAVEAIQAGITHIVSWPAKNVPSRWHDSLAKSKVILSEAGIDYREAEQPYTYNPDLITYLRRQRTWSEETFGPGARHKMCTEHIRKELVEIEENPGDLEEWIDVTMLALDGAWRSGHSPEEIATALFAKFDKNQSRIWPDWRTHPVDIPIEHIRQSDLQYQDQESGSQGAR